MAKKHITVNQKAYDNLAPEYQYNYKKYFVQNLANQSVVLQRLIRLLDKKGSAPKILDVGCGVGMTCLIFKKSGFDVKGIDISKEMIRYAKRNIKNVDFEISDFLEYQSDEFDAISMAAFLHLFPQKESVEVVKKARNLLKLGGYIYASTTTNGGTGEGYFDKPDYQTNIERYRKFWKKEDLIKLFESQGFKLVDFYTNDDTHKDKDWMNFIFQRIK